MTNCRPFNDLSNVNQVYETIVNKKERPKFNTEIPTSYKKLIEKCWAQEIKERPTFIEILNILRTDNGFITDKVNEEDYKRYIKYIDESNVTFDTESKLTINDIIELDLETFHKNDQRFHLSAKGIFETETDNIHVHLKYLDMNDFEKQGIISKDNYKKVYEIIDKRTGMKYVAKQINKLYLNHSIELNIIAQLHHPSVVKFIGYSPTSFKNKNNLVIVTELCPNRTLEDILQLVNNNEIVPEWTETKKLICIYGIASVLSFLHSNKITYLDLKPDNIILDDFLFPKLIDFDQAETQENEHSLCLTALNDSSVYKAPEVLNNEDYDTSADVYSFSIVLYELITNIRPIFNFFNVIKKSKELN